MHLYINNHKLEVEWTDNPAVHALLAYIREKGSLELELEDYGSMEKLGLLPEPLPANDWHISVEPGDIMLYQGKYFVLRKQQL